MTNPYEDPFTKKARFKANLKPSAFKLQTKDKNMHEMIEYPKFPSPLPMDSREICKTKFVKFRDIKHVESYDVGVREDIERGEVLNPLKESLVSLEDLENMSGRRDPTSFSIKKTCFERVENKLVYALTEAFREGKREDLDPGLSLLVHEILHHPGEPAPVVRFFKKGLEELDLSQRHLWKFFKVCRQFLKVERENFARRQERSLKALRDFAVRRFVKETEITVVRKPLLIADHLGDELSLIGSSSRSVRTMKRNKSATRIAPSKNSWDSKKSPPASKNKEFYIVRREDGASSRRRRMPRSQRLPKIYVNPLLMKLYRANDATKRPRKANSGYQSRILISTVTFIQDFTMSQMGQSVCYDIQGRVFKLLEKRGFIVISVANLLEVFEMMFEVHQELFEIEVKIKLVEFFLKNRFQGIKQQISETFSELNISGFFKDIHNIQDNSHHK